MGRTAMRNTSELEDARRLNTRFNPLMLILEKKVLSAEFAHKNAFEPKNSARVCTTSSRLRRKGYTRVLALTLSSNFSGSAPLIQSGRCSTSPSQQITKIVKPNNDFS